MLLNKARVELVAPFFWYKGNDSYDWSRAVDELIGLNQKIELKTVGGRVLDVSISRLFVSEDHPEYFNKFEPKKYPAIHVESFIFFVNIEYEEQEAIDYYKEMEIGADNACRLYEGRLESDLVKSIVDIILAANIAQPGSFRVSKLHSFIDSKFKNYFVNDNSSYHSSYEGVGFEDLHEVVSYDDNTHWPPIDSLDIIETYNWLKGMDGFSRGAANTSLGVAFGAFSYLMRENNGVSSKSSLMWSLMGLESLYCVGSVGLRLQLVEKTEVFLGVREKRKKKFGAMYDYRSRLIHGDINIVFRHHQYDGSKEQEKFDKEFYSAEKMALSVLISTFQRMCVQNLYSLTFKYSL